MDGHENRSPGIGDLAKDTATGRVGVIRDTQYARVQMRPVNGGREWEALPENVVKPTAREELSARNEAANRRSQTGALTKAGK
ncbi:hypothetical protein [Streptomyces sp. NPDC048489]|uniref:hypothetical protein n=1 Tax=Streptomyces sp. NPDC048489 TaxID=3154504 RepID=UPI00341E3FB6